MKSATAEPSRRSSGFMHRPNAPAGRPEPASSARRTTVSVVPATTVLFTTTTWYSSRRPSARPTAVAAASTALRSIRPSREGVPSRAAPSARARERAARRARSWPPGARRCRRRPPGGRVTRGTSPSPDRRSRCRRLPPSWHERGDPPPAVAAAAVAVDLRAGGRDLHGHTPRRGAHHALDAGPGRDRDEVAGPEPVGDAGGDLEVPDLAFDDELVLGDVRMPVIAPVVAGAVRHQHHLHALVADEGIGGRLLQVADQEDVPVGRQRAGVLGAADADDVAREP